VLTARRFIVSGRVQRVGFRFFVYEAAEREAVAGFVRNLRDGRVEIVAEGEAEALRRFESSIRQGPPGARVDEVETEVLPASGRPGDFTVRG